MGDLKKKKYIFNKKKNPPPPKKKLKNPPQINAVSDSLWSERYSLDDDVTGVARAFKGHDLQLIHGTLDLSAHYHQAMVFSKALIEAGILYTHLVSNEVFSFLIS